MRKIEDLRDVDVVDILGERLGNVSASPLALVVVMADAFGR